MAEASPRSVRSGASALLLLGWIGAIKGTGAGLVTVSLVDATASLGLEPFLRSASASAISLAIAATALAAGVAADRLGRRRVLMGSFVIAGAANLVIFAVPNGIVFLAGNIAAGVGYGAMTTGSYAYVKAVAPGKGLGWALGLLGMYTTLVCTVTMVVGGALAGVDWRLLYLIVPLMCVLGLVLTPRLLPPMPRTGSGPMDIPGLVLAGAGLVLVISGITQMTARGLDALSAAFLVGGVLALGGWVVVERRSRHPSFPIRIFRNGRFVAAIVVGLVVSMTSAAMGLGLSDLWQYVARDSVLVTTFGMQPTYLVGAVGGLVAGHRLSAGMSPRAVMTFCLVVAAAGFLCLVPVGRDTPYFAVLPGMVLAGMGVAGAITAQGQVIVRAAPPDAYGPVTASKTSFGQIGSALGMILTILFLDRMTASGVVAALRTEGLDAADAGSTLTALDNYLTTGRQPGISNLTDALHKAMTAYDSAFGELMLVSAGLLIVAALAAWLLMARGPRHRKDEEQAETQGA